MYTLTATLGNVTKTIRIKAVLDQEALVMSTHAILDEAHEDKAGPWAKGAITLTDPDGYVIDSMEAK
jgi:hypothetical protein